jgi:hypothetical protein
MAKPVEEELFGRLTRCERANTEERCSGLRFVTEKALDVAHPERATPRRGERADAVELCA